MLLDQWHPNQAGTPIQTGCPQRDYSRTTGDRASAGLHSRIRDRDDKHHIVRGRVVRFNLPYREHWTATPVPRRAPRESPYHFCLRTVISKNLCAGALPTMTSPVSTQSPRSFSFMTNAI